MISRLFKHHRHKAAKAFPHDGSGNQSSGPSQHENEMSKFMGKSYPNIKQFNAHPSRLAIKSFFTLLLLPIIFSITHH
jgi:hypothetical protein